MRVERSAAACALPRPSANASAKFANSTVSHNHAETIRTNPGRPASGAMPRTAATPNAVVKRLPMKTTNITGLRTCTRGLSLANASRIACSTMGRLSPSVAACVAVTSVTPVQLQVFHDRPQRQRGQERQGAQ